MILRDLLRVLGTNGRDGRNLTSEEAFRAFDSILSGEESEIRIGAFLIALRIKGASVEVLWDDGHRSSVTGGYLFPERRKQ